MKTKLKLIVDNEVNFNDSSVGSEEKLIALKSLANLLQKHPVLTQIYSLKGVDEKIDKINKKTFLEKEKLILSTKEKFGHLIKKRELQSEFVDFCKSIKKSVVCERELDFSVTFHHHILIGVIATYRLTEECFVGIFTGVSGDGVKHSSLFSMERIFTQAELDNDENLKNEIAHCSLSNRSEDLNEFHREFICDKFGIVYGYNNVVSLNSKLAKVIKFKKEKPDSNGPFAG